MSASNSAGGSSNMNDEKARNKAFQSALKCFLELFPSGLQEQFAEENCSPVYRLQLTDTIRLHDGLGKSLHIAVECIRHLEADNKDIIVYVAIKPAYSINGRLPTGAMTSHRYSTQRSGEILRALRLKKTSLKQCLAMLPEGEFVRVHRSSVVRLAVVHTFCTATLTMTLRVPPPEESGASSSMTRADGTVLKPLSVSHRMAKYVERMVEKYQSRVLYA
jgi:hypothetical protein